jgi:GNAT superfamily N-acetyltransferase
MLTISQVHTRFEIEAVQELLREYIPWVFTLVEGSEKAPTFEGMEQELATLPGIYAPPAGRLLLAMQDGQPAGCIALKKQDAKTGELKRLYVRPTFRGLNIGKQLVTVLIEEAREAGYTRLALDSHISMTKAHEIYHVAGFRTVSAPPDFPEALKPIVVFMELTFA